jgi:hypothetical protein
MLARIYGAIFVLCVIMSVAEAQQIGVNPTGVNVNAHGATSVFLTYGPIRNYVPAEACWAGELISAAPDLGLKPDPATLFGCLPARYNRSTTSQVAAFTDVMSIPPSVALRAYQAAVAGADSRFFYVRRFVSTVGGPDQFVAVTCRLTGGGARTPFSLTDVKLSFDVDTPVLLVKPGEPVSRIKAEITYTGTGRLKGRWEVVLPGEEAPSETDLLTESTLPIERRALQRRFTQLTRFDVFLAPVGRYTLPGPDPSRLPSLVEGPYLVLLRVEASDDKEADSDLSAVGVGPGVVHSGAVAGFPVPPLHYFVGSGTPAITTSAATPLAPADNESHPDTEALDFKWTEVENAAIYKLELVTSDSALILSALLPKGVATYRAPSWLRDRSATGELRWRIVTLDQTGQPIGETVWRRLKLIAKR